MVTEELAINGGRMAKRKPFPDWPVYDDREMAALTGVLESRQWWRGNGTQAVQFEQEFAAYHNTRHAMAVTNGTHALELVLSALDIGRGDEVIVPAFTFVSTATAVLCANAVPVLVDVDPQTYCLDPGALEAAITPRTRAIIPVHMAGHPANMDAIGEIARRHNLAVIEDAAHGQGAEWNGQRVGALHTTGIFSFQAFKLMTAGEGGIVLSNDAEFIERCFLYGNCGRPKNDRTYQHSVPGSNYRMSEMHAAVLRVQLARLDEQIARRDANAALLELAAAANSRARAAGPRPACDAPSALYAHVPLRRLGLRRPELGSSLWICSSPRASRRLWPTWPSIARRCSATGRSGRAGVMMRTGCRTTIRSTARCPRTLATTWSGCITGCCWATRPMSRSWSTRSIRSVGTPSRRAA